MEGDSHTRIDDRNRTVRTSTDQNTANRGRSGDDSPTATRRSVIRSLGVAGAGLGAGVLGAGRGRADDDDEEDGEGMGITPIDFEFEPIEPVTDIEIPDGKPVSMLWYNTWLLDGMKGIASKPELNNRAWEIGHSLDETGYDIMAMCENFRSEQRTIIEDEISGINYSWAAPDSSWVYKHSGLHTIARGEADIACDWPGACSSDGYSRDSHVFDERGNRARDADYYANKGVQYNEIDVGPGSIDLFSTHMLSGGGLAGSIWSRTEKWEYRKKQLEEVEAFIEKNSHPNNPTVVAGDFNIAKARGDPDWDAFQEFMDTFDLVDVLAESTNVTTTQMDYTVDKYETAGPVRCEHEGKYCADHEGSYSDDSEDFRLDYILVEESKDSHAFDLGVDTIRRRHFYRSDAHLEHWHDDIDIADRSPPTSFYAYPDEEISNYMSDHIGLDVDFLVSE